MKHKTDTTEEYLKNLKACINCINETQCLEILPFPDCLSECCNKWEIKKAGN